MKILQYEQAILKVTDDRRMFYFTDGILRKINSSKVLSCYKHLRQIDVKNSDIVKFKRGADVPLVMSERPSSPLAMRDWILRKCHGVGLEFGAGSSPGRVPVNCSVKYIDRFTTDEMKSYSSAFKNGNKNLNEPIEVDLVDSFHTMKKIENESVDFIYASHVIEHVSNPIGAIIEGIKRLKKKGLLIMTVPNQEKTFDKKRPETSIGHFIQDHMYESNSFEHYFDRLAYVHSPSLPFSSIIKQAKDDCSNNLDVHHHTFTPESFKLILKYIKEETGFSSSEVDDGSGVVGGIEFYVTIEK